MNLFLTKFSSCGFLSNTLLTIDFNSNMKNLLFSLCLGLFITTFVSAQPGLKFNDTRHEFSDVVEGTYPTWVFSFINNGNQDLKLTDVKASCGCTSPFWSRDPIKPGDSGQVKVVFNSNGYAGRQFAKSVTITTNIMENGQPKQEFLFINGKVVSKMPEIPQYPAKFSEVKHDLGIVKPGKKVKWPIMIINNGDSILSVKDVICTCSCITFDQKIMTIAPHQSAGINATLNTKGITPKSLSETIKVLTNIPAKNLKALSEDGYNLLVNISAEKTTK